MSLVRPEVKALFFRYRELIAAIAFMAAGALVLSFGGLFWGVIGALLVVAGFMLGSAQLRRLAFQSAKIGPGVVEVDERQVSYLAAYEGGAVSINALARVSIITTDAGPVADDLHWVLEEDGGTLLTIPNAASGSEKLFDALSALDGVDYAAATKALSSSGNDSYVIWSKPRTALH